MATSLFYAITADLVNSRKVDDRPSLAKALQRALAAVNQDFKDEWEAELIRVKGLDEFSGVLRRPRRVFDVVVAVNEAMWPLRFRFAMAAGALDQSEKGTPATLRDGPAFHRASEAMAKAKQQRFPLKLWLPDLDTAAVDLAESAALLHGSIMQEWTPVQRETVSLYRRLGHQGKVAEQLHVTQQSVSDALRKAHSQELLHAEDAIRAWISASPS